MNVRKLPNIIKRRLISVYSNSSKKIFSKMCTSNEQRYWAYRKTNAIWHKTAKRPYINSNMGAEFMYCLYLPVIIHLRYEIIFKIKFKIFHFHFLKKWILHIYYTLFQLKNQSVNNSLEIYGCFAMRKRKILKIRCRFLE